MPMHYPPLADGTFRYGDPPRPLPSPVPGPDPHQGPPPHGRSAGTAPGHLQGPPPHGPFPGPPPAPGTEPPGERRVGGRSAVIAGGVLGALVVAALGLSVFGPDADRDHSSPPAAPGFPSAAPAPAPAPDRAPGAADFRVQGTFVVESSPGEPVSGDGSRCTMPSSLSDIGEGTTIRLLDAERAPISASQLAYESGDAASCTFTFAFDSTPAGEPYYVIQVPARGHLVYTERELREGIDITLGR